MKPLLIASAMTAVLMASPVSAKVRCGQMLAKPGDSRGFVLKHCGQPDSKIRLVNRYGAQTGEEWRYYTTGYNSSTKTIIFRGDSVTSASERPN